MEGTSRTFMAGALRLHYVEWGAPSAPPIVLLHGLRAYAYWFEEFAQVASSHFRLIALDQRGRGASGRAPDGQYTTDAYVADLEALRVHLGLPRMSLMGHSMGGANIINYAAQYPQHVECLVIIDSAPELDDAGLTRIRSELGRTPADFTSRSEARQFLRSLHARASDRSLGTRLQWMLEERSDGTCVWRIDPAIFDPRMAPDPPERTWAALRLIKKPTLIVRGSVSDLITREIVQRMSESIPACRTVEVPGAGHMVIEDNPDEFNARVMPFLTETLRPDLIHPTVG